MVRSANEKSKSFYITLAVCAVVGGLLIYYDFGVVAFVMAVFVGIFGYGLRDKFSNETTASAYSVFNKDGKSIVGGFTASQFERQMRGPLGRVDDDDPVQGPIAEHLIAGQRTSDRNNVSEAERNRRRRAAAAAAERRFNMKEE
mmetsp:Transcript_150/g.293  ORF Transcript_150/g.293 Transcript_150/m.293 type:complete len:144 (-) Transcript_150:3-434(-)